MKEISQKGQDIIIKVLESRAKFLDSYIHSSARGNKQNLKSELEEIDRLLWDLEAVDGPIIITGKT